MKNTLAGTSPAVTGTYPSPAMKELFDAVLLLKNPEETANFFRDLLTIAELEEFANRWQIVKRLYQKQPYAKIAADLKVSTATVTRVAYWLNHGMGGYESVAKKIFGPPAKKTHG